MPVYLIVLMLIAFLVICAAAGGGALDGSARASALGVPGPPRSVVPTPGSPSAPPAKRPGGTDAGPGESAPLVTEQPGGGREIFAGRRILVAYYGTAGTGSLGVLGEASPERILPRLRRAAEPFGATGRPVQPVFELISTVAHAGPTRSGTYSSDIDRDRVARYVRAAHRHGVLLVLDLQPGRSDFLTVAKRWEWALRNPWVGLALDPEWRMGPTGVPGRRIGSVGAAEVNRVSRWLDRLTADAGLPQKVLVLHQFRADMIRHPERIRVRENLALVQHVDGFGTRREKLATYDRVARPRQFHEGFKLFYDEDVRMFRPRQVLRLRPRVDFVSYQ